jgi:hypothetical protein
LRTAAGRNRDYLDTSIFRFVSEESQERRPSLIVDVFRQESTTQRSHSEILHRDHSELRDEPFAQVVRVILAEIADPFVLASQQESRLPPAPRPAGAAG